MEMDKINWNILSVLQENARLSFAEIGRRVGLSAPAIAERIQKMEDENVIKSYGVDLDFLKLGRTLTAIMSLRLNPGKLPSFLKFVPQVQEVFECHRVTGIDCIIMKLAVRKPSDLDNLIDKFYEYGEPTTSVILSSPINNIPVRE